MKQVLTDETINAMLMALGQDTPEETTTWISVKDRLPELPDSDYATSDTVIIAYTDEDRQYVSFGNYKRRTVRDVRKERWKDRFGRILRAEVTHWMPLPKPPKK